MLRRLFSHVTTYGVWENLPETGFKREFLISEYQLNLHFSEYREKSG
jgi:hypothetical protein